MQDMCSDWQEILKQGEEFVDSLYFILLTTLWYSCVFIYSRKFPVKSN